MIKRFFSAKSNKANTLNAPRLGARAPCLPENMRLYAIGDIHGRADLLTQLLRQIEEDARNLPSKTEKILVFLGDYIDRGHESREVLDLLLSGPLPGFTAHFL